MEQSLEKSGWNLNPMFYWQYVMNKSARVIPEVRFIDYPLDEVELIKIAYENPGIHFTVETEDNPGGVLVHQNNVKYVWRKLLNPQERLKALGLTDYVICREDDPLGLEAGLCGVEVKHYKSIQGLSQDIENLKVLDSVERITNWEKTKSLLT